jgi:hypothetical protein
MNLSDRTKVVELIIPALNVLRAVEVEMLGCECKFKYVAGSAADDLLNLMMLLGVNRNEV